MAQKVQFGLVLNWAFVFKESMELHRISLLLFNLMIVRLVAEGNALALKLL